MNSPWIFSLSFVAGWFLTGSPGVAFDLPDTGITKCYSNTEEIPCPSPGQPFYGQDAQYGCNPMSYTDNHDGTVTDNVTGLDWQREDDNNDGNWDAAMGYCDVRDLGGHTDWRLPDVFELQSIVDYGRYSPSIASGAFPGTQSMYFWSSSIGPPGTTGVWSVGFSRGLDNFGSKSLVGECLRRCVRGGGTARTFTDNGDGTVTDTSSHLMWQKQDDHVTRSWQAALAYCEDLVLPTGGHSDWRLPNVKELKSIVDNTRSAPAVDPAYFPGTSLSEYWSSSTLQPEAFSPSYAWVVDFEEYGGLDERSKPSARYVRCVRDSQAIPCIDNDQDGYGNPAACSCPKPGLDCDDSNPAVNPGAREVCGNRVDEDCDQRVDEGCFSPGVQILLLGGNANDPPPPVCTDLDGDGYGNPASVSCSYYPESDCDDTNADVNPGAVEERYGDPVCDDALDNDCDGFVDGADSACWPTPQSLLPDTGIMTCSNNFMAIECPAPGQPFYGQDAQYVTNPMSYTDNGDGTVTDNLTGFMWQQCSAGRRGAGCSAGSAALMSWVNAIIYCENLVFPTGGHSDWRLPDRYELQGLVDYSRPYPGPTIDTAAFPGTVSGRYWSSSTYADYRTWAWYVDFSDCGVKYYESYLRYVRCVR